MTYGSARGQVRPGAIDDARTRRFLDRRGAIVNAASAIIGEHGAGGLSLARVGDLVGLSATSVTYYFKRRDDLAEACFSRALDRLEALVAAAAGQPDARTRVARLVEVTFPAVDDRDGVMPLFDLRSVEEPMRAKFASRLLATLRKVEGFFGEGGDADATASRHVRAHLLVDALFALPRWLPRHEIGDREQVGRRLVDVLSRGLAALPRPSGSELRDVSGTREDEVSRASARRGADARFSDAATRLINSIGDRGAVVDRVSAELKVTKGSFYHHLRANEDVVLEAFARSFDRVAEAQEAADRMGGSGASRLSSVVEDLLAIQLSDATPLLRAAAVTMLPPGSRRDVELRSDRAAFRFAGVVVDGMADGSIVPVDPIVAGQVLLYSINSAHELRGRLGGMSPRRSVRTCADVILRGLFADERG